MAAEFLSATILLILVIDPFGNVPLVAAALAATPAERRVRVVLRECLIAYACCSRSCSAGTRFSR